MMMTISQQLLLEWDIFFSFSKPDVLLTRLAAYGIEQDDSWVRVATETYTACMSVMWLRQGNKQQEDKLHRS